MKRWTKVLAVLGGYAFAILTSIIVVAIYDRRFTSADNDAYSGMIAGGEMILGAGVYIVVSLVPTGYVLWSLWRRRSRRRSSS